MEKISTEDELNMLLSSPPEKRATYKKNIVSAELCIDVMSEKLIMYFISDEDKCFKKMTHFSPKEVKGFLRFNKLKILTTSGKMKVLQKGEFCFSDDGHALAYGENIYSYQYGSYVKNNNGTIRRGSILIEKATVFGKVYLFAYNKESGIPEYLGRNAEILNRYCFKAYSDKTLWSCYFSCYNRLKKITSGRSITALNDNKICCILKNGSSIVWKLKTKPRRKYIKED